MIEANTEGKKKDMSKAGEQNYSARSLYGWVHGIPCKLLALLKSRSPSSKSWNLAADFRLCSGWAFLATTKRQPTGTTQKGSQIRSVSE
jgi:hypothetical protein